MTPFTIPNVPTDNLYKFYALSGIIIVIFSVSIKIFYMSSFTDEVSALEYDIQLSKFEKYNLSNDLNEYSKLSKSLDEKLKDYDDGDSLKVFASFSDRIIEIRNNPDYRQYLEFVYKHKANIVPEVQDLIELKKISQEMKIKTREIEKENIKIDYKLSNLNGKKEDVKFINLTTTFLIALGVFLSFYGFKLWKKNVQDIIDKKLVLELKQLENIEK